uniref:eukaryotic translation initiation factor 2D n=1 Tax=Myxine glutinosa TaxID=7769 RepID=UPI00358E780E
MFVKPFRVKSNSAMKGSESRKLRADILAAFPKLSAEQLWCLLPGKRELAVVRAIDHHGQIHTVYFVAGEPAFFVSAGRIVPTVYTLWKFPDLLPSLTTWPPVLTRLAGGADLMLPGVVIPPEGLPVLQIGQLCSVHLVENRAPVAVGVTFLSSANMLAVGMRGRGVNILHTMSDHLWAFGPKSNPPIVPLVEPEQPIAIPDEEVGGAKDEVGICAVENGEGVAMATSLAELVLEEQSAVERYEDEQLKKPGYKEEDRDQEREQQQEEDHHEIKEEVENRGEEKAGEAVDSMTQEQHDWLLLQCCLHTLKSRIGPEDLPLTVATFYGSYILPSCPKDTKVDIKKSSFKKLSRFMSSLQRRGLLQVKEISRGVQTITGVAWTHPEIVSFSKPRGVGKSGSASARVKDVPAQSSEYEYQPPDIVPLFIVPVRLQPLFACANIKKGAVLNRVEVREVITRYVKENELVDRSNHSLVCVDPVLCDSLLDKEERLNCTTLRWDMLFSRCMKRLNPCHKVVFPGRKEEIRKGDVVPIEVTVARRGGNKKVTLVRNLELFGVDLEAFGRLLQRRAQASVTSNLVPGHRSLSQLQVQGNQVALMSTLLVDEYKIPSKYITGLEAAVKGKK